MSNESSASETTPLRRPESELSSDTSANVTSSYKSNKHVSIAQTTLTVPNINDTKHCSFNSNSILHSGNNNLLVQQQQQQQQQQHQQEQHQPNQQDMDTNKRILFRVGLDVLILLCVGFPILLYFLMGKAYKRGFFCDDESLMHPFKESTVRNWMMYIIGMCIPVGVILIVELVHSSKNKANGSGSVRRYVILGFDIPDWLIECYKKLGVFAFGAAVSQLTTDIAKYSIGRLRPHFMAVCQPMMPGNTTCSNPINAGKYIVDFECIGAGSTPRMLKEMRLSFPSGHSSFTFYTMVYVALYLQARMSWRGSRLLRHLLQFAFIMIAWFTALSRVSDYKHHWSDVLAGSAIGATCALVVANYVSDLFPRKSHTTSYLPRSSQDLSQTHSTVVTTAN